MEALGTMLGVPEILSCLCLGNSPRLVHDPAIWQGRSDSMAAGFRSEAPISSPPSIQ